MSEENKNEHGEVVSAGGNDGSAGGSSTNMQENVAALLCYLATFVTGIIFILIEKKSNFVRFHAMQSIVFFGAIWVLGFVVDYVPYIGWLIRSLLSLLGFIMWIVFMIKAYQKEYFKFPIVGQIAEDFVNKK